MIAVLAERASRSQLSNLVGLHPTQRRKHPLVVLAEAQRWRTQTLPVREKTVAGPSHRAGPITG